MNYENYTNQFLNLVDHSDEKISSIITKIYDDENHWIILEVDSSDITKEQYHMTKKFRKIIIEFRESMEKTYLSLFTHIYNLLEGDIPADTQIKLRSVQSVLKSLKNDRYINNIVNICINVEKQPQYLLRRSSVAYA